MLNKPPIAVRIADDRLPPKAAGGRDGEREAAARKARRAELLTQLLEEFEQL
jgi:hypothetical protein